MYEFFDLAEAHIADAGGNVKEGLEKAALNLIDLVEDKDSRLTTDDVDFNVLYDVFCNRNRINKTEGRVIESIVGTQFPFATGKLVHKDISEQYELALDGADLVVTETTSKRIKEDFVGVNKVGSFNHIPEGQEYGQANLDEKYVTTTNRKFGTSIKITEELILMDQTNRIKEDAKTLGEEGGSHRADYTYQKLQDIAVDATGELVDTGYNFNGSTSAIYANTHAGVSGDGGQTNDNLNALSYSSTNLGTVIAAQRRMKTANGKPMVGSPRIIVHAPELEFKADQSLASKGLFDTANITINPIKKYNMGAMPTSRIISTTAWYMGDFKRDLFWAWVWKPRFKVITTGGELSGIAVTYMWDYFGSCFWKDYRHVQRGNA